MICGRCGSGKGDIRFERCTDVRGERVTDADPRATAQYKPVKSLMGAERYDRQRCG
jgi:hypothetical protein